MENNRERGNAGEDIAVEYLENKGYEIIKRNFHFGKTGEVDIIAKDKECLVFVEVKFRKNLEFGHPLESLNYKKIKSFRKAAEGYLYVNKIQNQLCRLDFIAILQQDGKNEIEHLKNIT